MAACGAPATTLAPVAAAPAPPPECDVSAAAASPKRAWLKGSSRPVVIAEIHGTDVQIASVTREIIITRWVPVSELGRAVRVETAVSHTSGGPPDPALFALPGFRVESTTTPWVQIFSGEPLKFTGFVPNSVTTTIFEEAPAREDGTTGISFSVRANPRDDAPVLAIISTGARLRVTGTAPAPWLAVTASAPFSRVVGFIKPPPPQPRESSGDDSGEIEIQGNATEWLPVGTCLRDAPNGKVVGAIVGTLWNKPKALPGGGTAVSVGTPWGDVTVYAKATITEVPDEEHFEWKWTN